MLNRVTMLLQELAVHLLWRQLEHPAWNNSFEPYWQSLPKLGTTYSKENWLLEPEHTALFQEPYLVRVCRELQDHFVFNTV